MMTIRSSGILLHPACLPGPFGIGDLGPAAFRLVDLLRRTEQNLWQILPLNPTRPEHNHSPYFCPSTFAGDPLLISPQILCQQGWLKPSECQGLSDVPDGSIDFAAAKSLKGKLLVKAAEHYLNSRSKQLLIDFCRRHRSWLDDYALFSVLNRQFKTKSWCEWPADLRDREPQALNEARKKFAPALAHEKVRQFFFFQQWNGLKSYCHRNRVRVFGDMPIYIPLHSADVWANPQCFKLDPGGRPRYISGVPPDYFSETGQLWGHPVYDWGRLRNDGYRWWMRRFAMHLQLFDLVRIDHFRGLVAYWQVPANAENALPGQWQPAPAEELLARVARRFGSLPVIAEDLGTIDAEVREVMRRWRLPGMRVLQFAFGEDFPDGAFLPHNHIRNCVVYTGTHDNNTVVGWFRKEAGEAEKKRLFDYLGREIDAGSAAWTMIRLAMQSVADTVVIPFQDLLGLDERARINHPARMNGNWRWRLSEQEFKDFPVDRLAGMTRTYGRAYPD